jgi:S-phase kinase-associated protein 1
MSESKFSGKKIKLHPEDGEIIDVPEEVTNMAKSIATMLADFGSDGAGDMPIPVKVKPDVLGHVIRFCTHYIENPPPKEDEDKKKLELSEHDLKFCNDLDQKTLFSVILAANFLDIKPLLDATCLHIALKLKSMTPEEIRKEYNITKEFTPEEEEKARKEFEEMILQSTTKK